ncbi:MAG: peptide deformylase [Flavobacteriales bacterium]
MVIPIRAYGDPILKKDCEEIDEDYPELQELINNMFETMYEAKGVGLAAPQVGKSIRLFVVDGTAFADGDPNGNMEELRGFKRVVINPVILESSEDEWVFKEGCLSIPAIREEVTRPSSITIEYYDENFELVEEELDGYHARIVQHEYDHVHGILFTDHLSPLRKRLLKRNLQEISKGNVDVDYKMKFPEKKGKKVVN